ncbi:MAG: hypothetical protein GY866_14820 [Proteobacteria bacterium]|nr:hypothetical protein [Pseudomonadota bacterium]
MTAKAEPIRNSQAIALSLKDFRLITYGGSLSAKPHEFVRLATDNTKP